MNDSDPSKPKRRGYQFRLWTLVVLVGLISLASWYGIGIWREKQRERQRETQLQNQQREKKTPRPRRSISIARKTSTFTPSDCHWEKTTTQLDAPVIQGCSWRGHDRGCPCTTCRAAGDGRRAGDSLCERRPNHSGFTGSYGPLCSGREMTGGNNTFGKDSVLALEEKMQ